MRKLHILILITAALMLSLPVSAKTIAYWDFADPGAADQAMMPGNASREADISGNGTIGPEDFLISSRDLSGNGNHLSAWTSTWMKWTATSFEGDFAMEATNGYPDSRTDSHWSSPTGIDVETVTPLAWTVECVFQANSDTNNRTLVGRIGQNLPNSTDTNIAALYLAERNNSSVNIEFVDGAGNHWNARSADNTITAGTWYHMAGVSDGATLRLYLKDLDAGTDYQVVASTDISSSTDPSLTVDAYDEADFAHNGGSWTVACGTWGGNTVDRAISPIRIDMAAISTDAREPGTFAWQIGPIGLSAYGPDPQPQNLGNDGSVESIGTLVDLGGGNWGANVTLNFKAGVDPNQAQTGNALNPHILTHYIYWNATDPNLPYSTSYEGSVPQTSLTDPNVSYGPITMPDGSNISWKVEEGIDDGTGSPYPPGDPNNIDGPVWSFFTVSVKPSFTKQPRTAVADPDATFTVTASSTAQSYQWFKVVGEQDSATNGESDDAILTDNSTFTGTTTNSLTVSNATLTDEGQYYCVCYNGQTASNPSTAVWLVTSRLVGHWKLDGNMTDSVTDDVPGAVTHDGFMAYGDPNYVADPDPNGYAGNGMRFFNDGEIMQLPDPQFFNFYGDGFTFIYWYKQYADAGWRLPMSKFDIGQRGWLFGHSGNNPNTNFIIENGGANAYTGTMTGGQWNMVAVTYDPSTGELRAFSNGDENDSDTVDLSALPLPVRPVQIGGDDAGGTPFCLNAAIGDVRMYSYPLTPTEIAAMYTDTVANTVICVNEADAFSAVDVNEDCRINFEDFALIASEWLGCQRIPTDACTW